MKSANVLINLLCGDFKANEKNKFFASLLYNVKLLQGHYTQHVATINMMLFKHPGGTNTRLLHIGNELMKVDGYLTLAIETFDTIHNTNEFSKWLTDYSAKKKSYLQLIPQYTYKSEILSTELDIIKEQYNETFYLLEILKSSLLKTLKNEHEHIKKSSILLNANKIINNSQTRFIKLFDDFLRGLLTISASAVAITLAFIGSFYKAPRILDSGIEIFRCFSTILGVCLLIFLLNLLWVIFFGNMDNKYRNTVCQAFKKFFL